ncbi:MAG: periplasmic heavy metal sensor [Pseudomonadota bacterium]
MANTPAKTARWVTILLVASVSLNVVVAGLATGALLRGPAPWSPPPPGPAAEIRVLERALPEEDRKAFRRKLVLGGPELRRAARELRTLRAATVETLKTEPLDLAALDAIFQRQQTLWAEIGQGAQAALLEHVETMGPAERAAFAQNLEEWADRQRPQRRSPQSD